MEGKLPVPQGAGIFSANILNLAPLPADFFGILMKK